MFFMLKKKKYVRLMFQNTIQIVKTSYSFNDFKRKKMALSCSKKLSALLRGITSKNNGDSYCLN